MPVRLTEHRNAGESVCASYYVDRWINSHDPGGSNRCNIQPDSSANCSPVRHHAICWYSTGTTSSPPT